MRRLELRHLHLNDKVKPLVVVVKQHVGRTHLPSHVQRVFTSLETESLPKLQHIFFNVGDERVLEFLLSVSLCYSKETEIIRIL